MNPLLFFSGYKQSAGLVIWAIGSLLQVAGVPSMEPVIDVGLGLVGIGASGKMYKQARRKDAV